MSNYKFPKKAKRRKPHFFIETDDNLHQAVKEWCVKNKTTIKKVGNTYFRMLVGQE